MEKILEYQRIDGKLFNLEKQLNESKHRKTMDDAKNNASSTKEKMIQIETEAQNLYQTYLELNKSIEKNLKNAEILNSQKIDNMPLEKLNIFSDNSNQVGKNLVILQKKATNLQNNIQSLLKEFNKLNQMAKQLKDQYAKAKELYDKEETKLAGEIETLKNELSALQNSLPKELFDKYQKIRKDRIYPVFIPLKDKICGACGMEMPSVVVDSIKSGALIECEHCRRILYFKNN